MDVASKLTALALCAAFASGGALAKTLAEVDGPAELPPAGYAGTQYIDSEGCVFLRAGYGGQVTWVPRVTRDRKVICGQTPTFAAGAAPAPSAATAAATATGSGAGPATGPATASPGAAAGSASAAAPPAGYVPAWKDDRLNPNRAGKAGTTATKPAGSAQTAAKSAAPKSAAPKSTPKAAAAQPVAAGGRYVQVGAFAVAANADRTVARLQAMGLPAAAANGRMRGKAVRLVAAGPFASQADLAEALRRIRAAGFPDAFIR